MNQGVLNTMHNPHPSTAEQQWFAALEGFRVIHKDVEQAAEAAHQHAEAQVEQLRQAFKALPAAPADCKAEVDGLGQSLEQVATRWMQQWGETELARQLSDTFADRLVLLVLGKVNAGKSSLINFLADRAQAQGLSVTRFVLDNGERVDRNGEFQEGTTENTSTLQGVEIGQRLLLLDSPGLYSVTPANHALTERFIAAADGALVLTNSGSPGLRDELMDLVQDLKESQRPVLVAISRSDRNESDEVNGELVYRRVNKSASNRQDQEGDVLNRAREALLATAGNDADVSRIWAPVSFSVRCARLNGATPEALADAGLDRLLQSLQQLAEQALAYKREKPLQLVREHRRQLQARLESDVLPRLASARQAGASAAENLAAQAPILVESVAGTGLRSLYEALQRHTADRDVNAAIEEVQAELREQLLHQVSDLMTRYHAELDELLLAIDPQGLGDYTESVVAFEQRKGGGWRVAGSAAGMLGGTAAGAAAGSMVPMIGNAVGAVIGGLLGSLGGGAAGSLGVRSHTVKELVGVSFDELQASVAPRMQQAVEQAVSQVLAQCVSAVHQVDHQLALIEHQLTAFAQQTNIEETE